MPLTQVQNGMLAGVIPASLGGTGVTTSTGSGSVVLNTNPTFSGGINTPNTFGFKNRVINGDMNIWQRGTSGSSGFVADRWLINSSNTTSAQSSDVPTGFRFSNLMTATSSSNAQLTQRVESFNCTDLVGQAITVSFWAKSTAGSTQLTTYITHANTQDNFGATTLVGSSGSFTLTSSWAQYSFTFTTSAPAGIVNGIQLGLFRNGTESSTTFITGVQLEKGTVATNFDYLPYGTELQLCMRYFEIVSIYDYPENQTYYGGWKYLPQINFIVPKRTTPTAVNTSQGGWPNGSGGTFTTSINSYSVQPIAQGGNALNNNLHNYSYNISAEL